MRRRNTIADQRLEFKLLGDDKCCWVEMPDDRIKPLPLELPDGQTIQPGDRLTRIGGKKTSAGYSRIDMLPGEYLTYLGQFQNLDGTLVLFDTREPKSHKVAFWHFGKMMSHFTPACASRLVELDGWVLA